MTVHVPGKTWNDSWSAALNAWGDRVSKEAGVDENLVVEPVDRVVQDRVGYSTAAVWWPRIGSSNLSVSRSAS